MAENTSLTPDRWDKLRRTTSARIALGRAGGSLPTEEWLKFKAAHASARDAVHNDFHAEQLASEIAAIGLETIIVDSAATDRLIYLQRPDLGRRLDEPSQRKLEDLASAQPASELAIIVSDGLSALAVQRQSPPLLAKLIPSLLDDGWRLTPVVIACHGRVALQDQIGQILRAQVALTLIGERPGLGSPDSLGAYLVYAPRSGNTDANRNCISNIRPEGLPWNRAAETIRYLLNAARSKRLSGVRLKDDRELLAAEDQRKLAGET